MAATPIRTALLAYGMSGKLFQAPFLAAHPGFELYAVVERTEARMDRDLQAILGHCQAVRQAVATFETFGRALAADLKDVRKAIHDSHVR